MAFSFLVESFTYLIAVMALQYFVLVTCAFFLLHRCFTSADQPVVYFPPFELRAVSGENTPFLVPVGNPTIQQMPKSHDAVPERILHTSEQPMTRVEEKQEIVTAEKTHEDHHHNTSVNVHELLHALGLSEEEHDAKDSRAAARDYDYQPYPHQPSYGYPPRPSYPPAYGFPPSYGSYGSYGPSASSYHEPPYAYVPPTVAHPPATVKPVLKPLVEKLPDLVKPFATKVAGKFSGLIGLVLSLLTGSITGDTELGGFKDLVINGIVKPLLVAKGGLKSLISKLSIPVISLLLINLEVLITVWWLWDDCEKVPVHPAPYPYPKPAYSYNSYR